MPTDKRAVSNWNRAQHPYAHYMAYIAAKPTASKFTLTFADLVFVKNFRGSIATIAEPVATFEAKIAMYEAALRACAGDPAFALTLSTIPAADYSRVRDRIVAFAALPNNPAAKISVFGVESASALLHFHFPNVVPILDKRALNGSNVAGIKVDKYNNVTNLLDLYPTLIDAFRNQLVARPAKTLRDLDYDWFSKELRTPPFHR